MALFMAGYYSANVETRGGGAPASLNGEMEWNYGVKAEASLPF